MKSPLCLGALAFLAAQTGSFATVTLQFSQGGLQATNWANAGGAGGTTLAWGVIIDRDGDGLAPHYMTAGVDYSLITTPSGRAPQELRDGTGVLTDDVLFMSPIVMTIVASPFIGLDGAEAGQNRITTIASVQMLPGSEAGDAFYLVWFDSTALTGVPEVGDKFGVFGDASFLLPLDGGTLSYASAFSGADSLKPMTQTWVPEPATGLLGLLGAVGLLRRRRL